MTHISMTRVGHGAVPVCPDSSPALSASFDKWSLLRETTAAKAHLGVSDRDLSVLAALLSFHPTPDLTATGPQTVFPSNATLSTRLHGMPESTLRRHLAALVTAGLITRRDSPNGKRFARRERSGRISRAFGFDLTPLALRASDILAAADAAREEAHHIRALRLEIALVIRDAASTASDATRAEMAQLHKQLRRKLAVDDLRDMLELSRGYLPKSDGPAALMSATDGQNERHYQNSDIDDYGSEEAMKTGHAETAQCSLDAVLAAAPDIASYAPQPIRTWRDLLSVGGFVAPMLGITSEVWQQARHSMGDDAASVVLACILQQADRIRRPGAYLRTLARKAGRGCFDAMGMLRALQNVRSPLPS